MFSSWDSYKISGNCRLADLYCHRKQIGVARQHLLTALDFYKPLPLGSWSYENLITATAYFAIGQKKAKQAVILFGQADGWRKLKKYILPPVYQAEFDRYLNQVREGLSESEFNAAWAEGQSMSQEQVLALAEEVVQ